MVSYRFIYSIWYCTNSYIIFYQFVFCIVPIPISYHTDSYCIVPICISYHTDMYHIVLICILPMVLLPWKWTSNWESWGNWPMSLTFLVVQFNSNLLLGQDRLQSVQWSMTRAMCLSSLSCLSTLVVATPSELFLSSLFFWRQLSFEICSNLRGSLRPPILQLNTIGFKLDWLILTIFCLNCLISCSALALVCNFGSTDANRHLFLTLS